MGCVMDCSLKISEKLARACENMYWVSIRHNKERPSLPIPAIFLMALAMFPDISKNTKPYKAKSAQRTLGVDSSHILAIQNSMANPRPTNRHWTLRIPHSAQPANATPWLDPPIRSIETTQRSPPIHHKQCLSIANRLTHFRGARVIFSDTRKGQDATKPPIHHSKQCLTIANRLTHFRGARVIFSDKRKEKHATKLPNHYDKDRLTIANPVADFRGARVVFSDTRKDQHPTKPPNHHHKNWLTIPNCVADFRGARVIFSDVRKEQHPTKPANPHHKNRLTIPNCIADFRGARVTFSDTLKERCTTTRTVHIKSNACVAKRVKKNAAQSARCITPKMSSDANLAAHFHARVIFIHTRTERNSIESVTVGIKLALQALPVFGGRASFSQAYSENMDRPQNRSQKKSDMILRSCASTHAARRSKASQRTALPLATKTACLRKDFFKMLRHVAQSVGQITRNNAELFEILLTSCSKCSASAAPQSAIHFSLREKNLHEAEAQRVNDKDSLCRCLPANANSAKQINFHVSTPRCIFYLQKESHIAENIIAADVEASCSQLDRNWAWASQLVPS